MRLKELLEAGDVEEAHGDIDCPVTGLAYDSRAVKKADIFFALPGARTDGHGFAPQAVEQGAAAVVLERKIAAPCSTACRGLRLLFWKEKLPYRQTPRGFECTISDAPWGCGRQNFSPILAVACVLSGSPGQDTGDG